MSYDLTLTFKRDTLRVFADGKIVSLTIKNHSELGCTKEAALHLTKEDLYSIIKAFAFIDHQTDNDEDNE